MLPTACSSGSTAGRDRGDVASLRHTAAYRMAQDPGAAADRCPVRARACPADHDTDLPDAAQGGRDPPAAGPSRRADPAGGGAGRARRRRPATGPRPWRSCSGRRRRDHRRPAAPRRLRHARRRHEARPDEFPAAARPASWPATRLDRAGVLSGLCRSRRSPRATPATGSRRRRRGAVPARLAGRRSPGANWQERWLASGADVAGRRLAAGARAAGCRAGPARRLARWS